MTNVQRFVKRLEARGMRVVAGDSPGELKLHGPAKERTPTLMHALKVFRPELVRIIWPDPDMPTDDARPDAVTADPKPLPTPTVKSAWETCSSCKAEVLAAEMPTAMALCDTPTRCPYRPAEVRTPTPYAPPSAPSSPTGPARPLLAIKPPPAPARPDLFPG